MKKMKALQNLSYSQGVGLICLGGICRICYISCCNKDDSSNLLILEWGRNWLLLIALKRL